MSVLALVALSLASAITDPQRGDLVELADGTKLEGRVVYQDTRKLVLRNGSRDRELEMKEVASVRSRAANLRRLLARARAVEVDDLRETLSLVGLCRELGLNEEAELFLWRALSIDPENEAAHTALGHQRRTSDWFVRVEDQWRAYASLAALHSQWGDEWELASTHYRLRTNLSLDQALGALLDLECLYDAFYQLFASDLSLYEVLEPMSAQIHADRSSFPELVSTLDAYFDPPSRTLYIRSDAEVNRGLLFHEGTHQILHMTAERSRSGTGEIPGWLGEGLAEYMRAGLVGDRGKAVFDPNALLTEQFAMHWQEADPITLTRLLNSSAADFLSSSRSTLMYAQAYTLVHFCLQGRNGLYRKGFVNFVRGAYRGKSSTTQFKDAVYIDDRNFEADWAKHVKLVHGGN